jgi:hypothetical protein
LERLARDKNSSLFDPFLSSKENSLMSKASDAYPREMHPMKGDPLG